MIDPISLLTVFQVTENIISKQTFIGENLVPSPANPRSHLSIVVSDIFPLIFSPLEARTMPRSFNNTGSKFMTSVTQRPSAHLTLRDPRERDPQGETQKCGCESRILAGVQPTVRHHADYDSSSIKALKERQ